MTISIYCEKLIPQVLGVLQYNVIMHIFNLLIHTFSHRFYSYSTNGHMERNEKLYKVFETLLD